MKVRLGVGWQTVECAFSVIYSARTLNQKCKTNIVVTELLMLGQKVKKVFKVEKLKAVK